MIQGVEPKGIEQNGAEALLHDGTGEIPSTERSVDGLILAGTHPWGNSVLELVSPRPLWPVAFQPLIAHSIEWLRDGGIGTAHICANSETTVLQGSLEDGSSLGTHLKYYEDRMPRGPAGCVRDAALATNGDAIVVIEGSIVPHISIDALLNSHFQTRAALTIAVKEGSDRNPSGSLEPVGIYVFSRTALSEIPADGYQDIKEVLIPKLYARGLRVVMHRVPAASAARVSGAASYLDANMWFLSQNDNHGMARNGFVRHASAWVHESATVAPTARLKGPVLIGAESHVLAGAMIIGPTVVGRENVIERDSVISRSVIWNQCTIGVGAVLDHSILTHQTTLDATAVARCTVLVAPRGRQRQQT